MVLLGFRPPGVGGNSGVGVLNRPDLPTTSALHHQPRKDAFAWWPRFEIKIEITARLPIDMHQCHVWSEKLHANRLKRHNAVFEPGLMTPTVLLDALVPF